MAAGKDQELLSRLQHMSEDQLTKHVIGPLLRKMFPQDRVEETHGPLEGGRDLIIFTKHPNWGIPHIICIQVKNRKISAGTGPSSVVNILRQVDMAKTTHVVYESGASKLPDEIWLLTTYPFPEGPRRLVQDVLTKIAFLSGKIVDGRQLVDKLHRHCPQLVSELMEWKDKRLSPIISALAVHKESRAFGLRFDRRIDEFHVNARVCPAASMTYRLLSGALRMEDLFLITPPKPVSSESARVPLKEGKTFQKEDIRRYPIVKAVEQIVKDNKVQVAWTKLIHRTARAMLIDTTRNPLGAVTQQYYREIDIVGLSEKEKKGVIVCAGLDASGYLRCIEERNESLVRVALSDKRTAPEFVLTSERAYKVRFAQAGEQMSASLEKELRGVPLIIDGNEEQIRRTLKAVLKSEQFLKKCIGVRCLVRSEDSTHSADLRKSSSLRKETSILGVGRLLLIEGGPGTGKTTLLRKIAMDLLSKGEQVLYVECSALQEKEKNKPLKELIRKAVPKGTPDEWTIEKSILLVDGLDEASFDLSSKIIREAATAKKTVVSVRFAFPTPLRGSYLSLELTNWNPAERDEFFERWFAGDPTKLQEAKRLIRDHRDIAIHTCVPLHATIAAAVIENGLYPRTKAEIYRMRLRLLVEEWDRVKGIRRTIPSEEKYRFLRFLAYHVHTLRKTTFSQDEMLEVYNVALGTRVYKYEFTKLLEELEVGTGVIVRIGEDFLSFGHLSFQEHLVGEYLADECPAHAIVELLDKEWWSEALRFYASIRRNITDLIDKCENLEITGLVSDNLLDMVRYAPNTSGVAIQCVKEARGVRRTETQDI